MFMNFDFSLVFGIVTIFQISLYRVQELQIKKMNKVEQHPGCESFCVYETTLKKSTDVNWRPEPQLCWQLDYSVQKSIHVN